MAETETTSLVLGVEGMTCASCVSRVEKSLDAIPGVTAAVNLATHSAKVQFPADVSPHQLVEAVEKLGYTATLPEANPHDHSAYQGKISLLERLVIAIVLSVPVIALAMVPAWQFEYWQWISLLLATPVVFFCGWPFHRATWMNIRHGSLTMDTLITIGTLAAWLWSAYALIFGQAGEIGMHHSMDIFASSQDPTHNIYLEVAAGVTTFVLLGRYLEERSKDAAGAALRALSELRATTATRLLDGNETVIPASDLRVGDVFLVRPGEIIPTDGVVLEGRGSVDESSLTGESMPVTHQADTSVTGSTILLDGRIVVRATRVGQNTRMAQLAALVEDAQLHKAGVQRLADRISAIFIPVVLGIAVLTFVGWLVAGAPLAVAFTTGIAVVLIACPCALGLATPMAILVGTGRAAQLGIIISGPAAIEASGKIRTVVLDKTGTLTTGHMSVERVEITGESSVEDVYRLVAPLEHLAEHPVAKAIARSAADRGFAIDTPVAGFESVAGRGVKGAINGIDVVAGTSAWLGHNGISAEHALDVSGTTVFAGWNGHLQAIFILADTLKDDSIEAVSALKELGLEPVLLTGDRAEIAQEVAATVGITKIYSEVTPEDKLSLVASLQKPGTGVAVVGDGVNDAAALVQADLGLAMGTGTDVAIAASDITLLRGTMTSAVQAIALARRTLGIIRGNLFWAFAYNVAAIPLAALGFLNPMLAGAAMAFSSLFVVLNSLRLRRFAR